MSKHRVFIGSSTEGLEVASAIQVQLGSSIEAVIWNQGVFLQTKNYLDSLMAATATFDYAVFVFRADDAIISRSERVTIPRGNVLFEMGLFMGSLGASRVFIVYDKSKYPGVISDLQGITMAPYEEEGRDLQAAIGPACFLIRDAIAKESGARIAFDAARHPALRSYDEYIGNCYQKYLLKPINKESQIEFISQQACRLYSDIHRANAEIGIWPSINEHDHHLVYLIASWIKENVPNPAVAKITKEKLAEKITLKVLAYVKGNNRKRK